MTLWDAFSTINDFRRAGNRRYDLRSLLLAYTLAVLSGCGTLRGCAEFCHRHRAKLMRRFHWRSTPSFSTLSLLLRRIGAQEAEQAFTRWMQGRNLPAEALCVDGKSLRGSARSHHDPLQHYTHTVQLFGQQSAQVRASRQDKDEVAGLLALLDDLPPGNRHIFTADACYTQKRVTRALRGRGHHYLLCVKANQRHLLAALQAHMAQHPSTASHACGERNRGREEWRSLESWPASFPNAPGWEGIHTVLRMERHRNNAREIHYYITSLPPETPVCDFAGLIRRHWHIENKLHYTKDVVLGEDTLRIRTGDAPYLAAILRNAAFNLARNIHPESLTKAIRTVAHDINALCKITGIPTHL